MSMLCRQLFIEDKKRGREILHSPSSTTVVHIAICELGSLQSDWPVVPPSARICAVYSLPRVNPLKMMCRESPVTILSNQSPPSCLMRPSYMLAFRIEKAAAPQHIAVSLWLTVVRLLTV